MVKLQRKRVYLRFHFPCDLMVPLESLTGRSFPLLYKSTDYLRWTTLSWIHQYPDDKDSYKCKRAGFVTPLLLFLFFCNELVSVHVLLLYENTFQSLETREDFLLSQWHNCLNFLWVNSLGVFMFKLKRAPSFFLHFS